ncbi:MAG TPA: hypothetical protein VFI16_05950 [Anaeromyxobacteraceae bacterium]|nr:hypothetical protein [Anaeromyxobacteraceae bacterium]
MSRRKRLDDLWEAVTFAEAGETDAARRIAAEVFPEEAAGREGERILAVSGASGFSRRLVENSLGMAERLDFGLIALSVPSAVARLVASLGAGRDRGERLPAEVFRARAVERGIPFVHAVRSGDPERAVAEARRRFRRIAFLLVESDLAPRARFAGVDVPIFYLADP